MPLEAVHVLVSHDAVGTKKVGTVVAASYSVGLLALAALARNSIHLGNHSRLRLGREQSHGDVVGQKAANAARWQHSLGRALGTDDLADSSEAKDARGRTGDVTAVDDDELVDAVGAERVEAGEDARRVERVVADVALGRVRGDGQGSLRRGGRRRRRGGAVGPAGDGAARG